MGLRSRTNIYRNWNASTMRVTSPLIKWRRDRLLQSYHESAYHGWVFICFLNFLPDEIQKTQCLAQEHSRRKFEENAILKAQLDAKQREIDSRTNQLDKLVAQNDVERMKLNDEKQKRVHGY